jgi:hypothetical protein
MHQVTSFYTYQLAYGIPIISVIALPPPRYEPMAVQSGMNTLHSPINHSTLHAEISMQNGRIRNIGATSFLTGELDRKASPGSHQKLFRAQFLYSGGC